MGQRTQPLRTKTTKRHTLDLVPGHILAWLYAVALVIPLYYLVVSAFKSNLEIFDAPFSLPATWDPSNFAEAWYRTQMGPALLNSVYITAASSVVVLVLALPAAYGIARSKGPVGAAVEKAFSLGFLIPAFAALVPTLLLSIAIGLFHTQIFLIMFLPATALPLSVILLVQFMRTVPPELEEAAMLDGASRAAILRHVYVPVVIPGIATVAILNFLSFWNEYLFVLVLGGTKATVRTAQVAVPTLISQDGTDFGVLAAATIVTLIPVYLTYIVLSRRMEEALLQGAVKN